MLDDRVYIIDIYFVTEQNHCIARRLLTEDKVILQNISEDEIEILNKIINAVIRLYKIQLGDNYSDIFVERFIPIRNDDDRDYISVRVFPLNMKFIINIRTEEESLDRLYEKIKNRLIKEYKKIKDKMIERD